MFEGMKRKLLFFSFVSLDLNRFETSKQARVFT